MSIPLHVLAQGLTTGLTYGLLALGLVLIYKTSRVLNFAHGELGVISALLLAKLVNDFGMPYWPTLAVVLVVALLIGAACELLLRRLFHRPRMLVMVATIGLSQLLFVLSLLPFIQPEGGYRDYPVPVSTTGELGGFVLQPGHFTILLFAPLAAVGIAAFFRLSPYGLAMRAAAENAASARLGGVWVKRMSTLAWMLAALLAAVTLILGGPFRANVFQQALGPGLMVRALAAALLGGMTSLPAAFVAGVGVGVVEQVVFWNFPTGGTVELTMFGLLLVALLVRARSLRTTLRQEERSSWQLGGSALVRALGSERRVVGAFATFVAVLVAVLLPSVLSNSSAFLWSRMFIFGVIALSLTLLIGWAGQVSLGQFGLVAVGAIVASRYASAPLPLVLVGAGLAGGLAALLVGAPALRIRGLYLAVITLGFAVFVRGWVLPHPRFGLPDPASTLVDRPTLLGIDFGPQRTFYYLALALLLLSIVAVRRLRSSGIGRQLLAVRENEGAAAAMGVRVVRVKLTAFAVSGFLAGVAGAGFAFASERLGLVDSGGSGLVLGSGTSFDPLLSIVLVSMVVIGGLGSVKGAVLGAFYLLGVPAVFGYGTLVEVLTGGLGLLVFVLYLPGGLAELLDRLGDLVTRLITRTTAVGPTVDDAIRLEGAR